MVSFILCCGWQSSCVKVMCVLRGKWCIKAVTALVDVHSLCVCVCVFVMITL